MNGDAWLSADAYAYLDDLSLAGLSWEFLRRNPDYQNDYVEAQKKEASCVAAAADVGARDRDWGLTFPCRSGSDRDRAADLLASGRGSTDRPLAEGCLFERRRCQVCTSDLAR